MKKVLKQYLIPHNGNDFRPHFFHEENVMMLATIIVLLFFVPIIYSNVFTRVSYFSAILPAVLTDLTNADRISNGLSPLSVNAILQDAARRKANDLAEKSYFAHISPEGKTPWFWFREAGYRFSYAGENLAVQFTDSADVDRAWMNSPGHRANILNGNFTEIGIAMTKGLYQNQETIFVVQLFGKPARNPVPSAIPVVISSPKPKPVPNQIPTLIPVLTPKVAPANIEVITENDTFIAVKSLDEIAEPKKDGVPTVKYFPQTAWYNRIFASPTASVDYIYMLLGILIFAALALDVFIEIRKQHPRHIAYASFLIFLIGGALYLQQILLSGYALII